MVGNMSYCRFENTLGDLRACREALDDGAAERLICICAEIADEYRDLVEA